MAEATKPPAALALPLAQARIAGRIAGMRRNVGQAGAVVRTLLKMPAPDAYSSPSTVEVRSTERLGQVGDEVAIVVSIGGYPRSYASKGDHAEDGGGVVRTAENVLSFVEHA